MVHGTLEHLINPALYVPQGSASGVVQRELFLRIESKALMALGVLMVGVAIVAMLALGGPLLVSEAKSQMREAKVASLSSEEKQDLRAISTVGFADYVEEDPALKSIMPADANFGVVIPKIEVNSKVIANVNANDADKYLPALKQGLVQAAGSSRPGQKGDNFIFGHSTDFAWNIATWNALFYNLKDLEKGDKIYVFYEGKPYVYQVTGKGVYEPEDVSFLNPNADKERLVLQTCFPPGTVLKRLVVFAERV